MSEEEDLCAEGTLSERGIAPFETMNGLNWIPQIKTNNISIERTNRIKARLLTKLKLIYIYISTKEYNFKSMVLYFRILEPNSLNIVKQYMYDKSITETILPFWYNTNDDEFVLKVSSHNCRCYVGFEKDVEYNIDVGFKKVYNYKIMDILVYYKT